MMKKKTFFSLTELVVILAIIAVVAGITIPILAKARQRSKQLTCINNLRNISMGMQLFHNEHETFPQDVYLRTALAPYHDGSDDVFNCPASGEPYEMFYVPRRRVEYEEKYFIGCPEHQVVNFAPGKGTRTFYFGRITHNGNQIAAGDIVEDGTLEFEDGSTASVTGKIMVLSSFRTEGGQLYTILRIFDDHGTTTVNVTVPPDASPTSKFEVITPAVIAGVAGTEFSLKTQLAVATDEVTTTVKVNSGAVEIGSNELEETVLTPAHPSTRITGNRKKAHQIPWGLRKKANR